MRIGKNHWLLTKPIAHRGLWNEIVPENSIKAYQNAIDNGYAIEIDIYLTKDKELVCFHDNTLTRMTGADGFIYDKTLTELKGLRLNGTQYGIVTLDEVLALCNGKAPLLIELKNQPFDDFVEIAVNKLKDYSGEFAVQSFNPTYLTKIKKLAPNFLRGVLGTAYAPYEKKFVQFVVKNMPLNSLVKPDFISYRHDDLPLKKRKVKDLPVITWTVTDQPTFDKVKHYAKNIIFENFIPR